MRHTRAQKIAATVTMLALLLGSVGPLMQQVCAGMMPTALGQETCVHHDGTSDARPCSHGDRGTEGGDVVAPPTMDCCDEAAGIDGEALLPTRFDGASLDGRSIRSVQAPVRPETTSATAMRSPRVPLLSARAPLFLRHDAFLE